MPKLEILTIAGLAENIVAQLELIDLSEKPFPACDFSPLPFEDEDLELVHSAAEGWYGIKAVDTGFDSYDLNVVADYYGGGNPQFFTMEDGLTAKSAAAMIAKAIGQTLMYDVPFYSLQDRLIVEWLEEGTHEKPE